MRYVIVGAGGIGGAIGGRLAEAGQEVVLVARGAHAAAMRESGLRLGIPERVIVVHPQVVEAVPDLVLDADDVLMLCVKSQDTAPLLRQLAVLPVGESTAGRVLPLVCVQNGISNEAEALRLFRHVHGIKLSLQATHLEPGKVSATGSPVTGVLELGRYPLGSDEVDERVAADLNGCGFSVVVRDDVMAWKRAKILSNLRNALEALCGFDVDPATQEAVEGILRAAVAEARACFAAGGMSVVSDADWKARLAPEIMTSKPVEGRSRTAGSTWQSVTRGLGAVETDYLNGEIVLLGRLLDVPTPVNERLQLAMVDLLRTGGAPGSVPPAALMNGM